MKKSFALIIAIFALFVTTNLQAQVQFDLKNVGDKVVLKLEGEDLCFEETYDNWSDILEDKRLMKTLKDSGIKEETILAEEDFKGNLKDGFVFNSEEVSIEYKTKENKKGFSISIDF